MDNRIINIFGLRLFYDKLLKRHCSAPVVPIVSTNNESVIDLKKGAVFQVESLSETTTFSIINAPKNVTTSFMLVLKSNGLAVTWPYHIKWSQGLAPQLSSTNEDVLVFFTLDEGFTWYGVMLIKDAVRGLVI